MKNIVALAVLTLCCAAHAHWEFSRFGMTRDELATSGQRAGIGILDGLPNGGAWGTLVTKDMKVLGENAEVGFSFDIMDGLEKIIVAPKGGCAGIRRRLVSALGDPNQKDTPYIGDPTTEETWYDDGHGNTLAYENGDRCFVTYTQAEEAAIAEMTRDAAQAFLGRITKAGWVRMYLDGGKKEYLFDHTASFNNNCGTYFITKTPFQANIDWSRVSGIWSKGDKVSVDAGPQGLGVLEYTLLDSGTATRTVTVMRYLARNCDKH